MRTLFVLLCMLLGCVHVPSVAADEPSGLQMMLAMQDVLTSAIAKAEKSVVAIARVRTDRIVDPASDEETNPESPDFIPNEFGSGVVIDKHGYILTNAHVLRDVASHEYEYYVWSNKIPYRAEVLATSSWADLAVLKVEGDDWTPITFGDTSNLKKGQIVISLGNPYGIARDGEVSASWGIISNLKRKPIPRAKWYKPELGKESLADHGTLISTDAKLAVGTSGGALINLEGEMIGLTTSLAGLAGYEKSGGFAIPMDENNLLRIKRLKQGQSAQFGFLGVAPKNLTAQQRRAGLHGAQIREVVAGTPAATAGLTFLDVITHINDVKVDDETSLVRDLSSFSAGDIVNLTVERRGRTFKLPIKLQKKYLPETRRDYITAEQPSWRGMEVDYATAIPPFAFRENSRSIDPAGCVAVVAVDTGSQAWKADVRPWTYISHVNGIRVSTPEEFYREVHRTGGIATLTQSVEFGNPLARRVAP